MEQTEMPIPVTTTQLDLEMAELLKVRDELALRKGEAAETSKKLEALKDKLLANLSTLGKEKWSYKGEEVKIMEEITTTVPKTTEEQKELFDYVLNKYGMDAALGYFKFSSQSINKFYREESAAAEDPSLFTLPGVKPPTASKYLKIPKSKVD